MTNTRDEDLILIEELLAAIAKVGDGSSASCADARHLIECRCGAVKDLIAAHLPAEMLVPPRCGPAQRKSRGGASDLVTNLLWCPRLCAPCRAEASQTLARVREAIVSGRPARPVLSDVTRLERSNMAIALFAESKAHDRARDDETLRWMEAEGRMRPVSAGIGIKSVQPHSRAVSETLSKLNDIGRHRHEELARLQREREAAEQQLEPALRTKTALHRVAWGTSEARVSDIIQRTILIDSQEWATWLRELGLAWRLFPGVDAERKHSVRSTGHGIDAAREILQLACEERVQVADLVRVVDLARSKLGTDEHGSPDSEAGLFEYFRQLDQGFSTDLSWPPAHGPKEDATSPTQPAAPGFLRDIPVHQVSARNMRLFLKDAGHADAAAAIRKGKLPKATHRQHRGGQPWYRVGDLLRVAQEGTGTSLDRIEIRLDWWHRIHSPHDVPQWAQSTPPSGAHGN